MSIRAEDLQGSRTRTHSILLLTSKVSSLSAIYKVMMSQQNSEMA